MEDWFEQMRERFEKVDLLSGKSMFDDDEEVEEKTEEKVEESTKG